MKCVKKPHAAFAPSRKRHARRPTPVRARSLPLRSSAARQPRLRRLELTKLMRDGRIDPAGIEEVVAKARQEVDIIVREEGERAAMEAGVHGLQPELLKIVGRLHLRTSYGQNVLAHSIEVSILAGTIAHELGADVN